MTDPDVQEFFPPEFPRVSFIDGYYKGFHAGITARGNFTAQDLLDQKEEVQKAIDQMVLDGWKPSWNTMTNKELETATTASPATSQMDLSIDGPTGQGGACPVHGTALVWKSGVSIKTNKAYGFWACPEKLSDGSFCKGGK